MPHFPGWRWWAMRGPFEMLDPLLRGPDRGRRVARWADLLASGRSLPELARDVALGDGEIPGITEDDVEHFTRHWLGGWFPDGHVEPVLRHGLAVGFAKAFDQGLPAEVLLVTGVADFQVAVAEGPGQVTILVCAPTPKVDPGSTANGAPGTVTIVAHVDGDISAEEAGGEVTVLERDEKDGRVVAVRLGSMPARST